MTISAAHHTTSFGPKMAFIPGGHTPLERKRNMRKLKHPLISHIQLLGRPQVIIYNNYSNDHFYYVTVI
ncbi:hypothetical protein LSH36_20g08039 [Paralvinella palmiformis]|uniref:Uncharacterized protein n=1 Tax=Paralvinella palmiformis TaxID=53620 RepID=A0AAD9NI91_9ANNE|nr:hypothetical protein LSH36_20g08039 [Paralvinella palmiformis]